MTLAVAILALSLALQLAAAIRAALLVRQLARAWPWGLMAAAFVLMAARKLIAFQEAELQGTVHVDAYEMLGLLVSAVLFGSVAGVGRLLEEGQTALGAVRLAEARYHALVEQSSEGIFLVDRSTLRVREANASLHALLGYSEAELRGLPLTDLVEQDPESLRRSVDWLAERRKGDMGVRRYRRKDGTVIEAEVSASLVSWAGEQGVLVNLADVTARRRQERIADLDQEIASRILAREPFEAIVQVLCDGMARQLGYPMAWVALKEPEGRISLRTASGVPMGETGHEACRWDDESASCAVARAIRTGERQMSASSSCPRPPVETGSPVSPEQSVAAVPLAAEGRIIGALVVHAVDSGPMPGEQLDVLARLSDRVALSLLFARQQERLELHTAALEATANSVVITERDGRIAWVNPAFTALTGYSAEEAIGRALSILKSGVHPPYFYERLWKTVLSGRTWQGEVFNRRKDGTIYPEEQTITPVKGADGSIRHFVAVKQDITARKRDEERLHYLAEHDALTDLPNRQGLEYELEKLVDRARRGAVSSVLLLDVDNFKVINDAAGHVAGDGVLVELSRLVRAELRPRDEVGRLGSDEFLVLLDGVDEKGALRTAERLRARVEAHRFFAGGGAFDLGITVAVAAVDPSIDVPTVLRRVDAAVHGAKEKGRNRIVAVKPDADGLEDVTQASRWAVRVKDALRHDRLVLDLQPIVRLGTARTAHHEVLLRMLDDDGARLGPGAFLAAAERFGLMPQVDMWVVQQALRRLADVPGLSLFVNLSGATLGQSTYIDEIERMLLDARLVAGRLTLELTETAVVSDFVAAAEWMRRLKEMGCRFALDDFGSGFCSFTYLQRLPADYVKIDGLFTLPLLDSPTNRAIIRAIVTVAHALGKETIAEWVETRDMATALRGLGVEYGQGWALGRPFPADGSGDETPPVAAIQTGELRAS